MEQQLSARLRERQIADFVEDHEVFAAKIIGQAPLTVRVMPGTDPR
jgi:hypothetical protein